MKIRVLADTGLSCGCAGARPHKLGALAHRKALPWESGALVKADQGAGCQARVANAGVVAQVCVLLVVAYRHRLA